MANSVKSGFLRVDQVDQTLGPVVVTSSGGTSDALTDTQLRATPVPVSGTITATPTTYATDTAANVASSVTVVTLQALNAARKSWAVYNDSATAYLYLKFGSAASLTSFKVRVSPGGYYEAPPTPLYTGIITGIWDAAVGSARVTEGS